MSFNFQKLFELLEQSDFEEIFNYIGEHIPKTIYKYYFLFDENSDYSIEENEKRFNTLLENKLWLSDFKKFNDPFEAKNLYTDICKLKQWGYDDEDIEKIKATQHLIENSYKATSFSGHLKDCMPMWAHYANNYKGYCVEYEVLNTRCIFPVFYDNTRNASTIFARILHDLCKCGKNPTKEMQNKVLQEAIILQLSYCIKHKSWEYENEYRILIPEPSNLNSCNKLGLKPVKIYTGLNTTSAHIDKLQAISSQLGMGDIAHCKVSEKEYQIEFS